MQKKITTELIFVVGLLAFAGITFVMAFGYTPRGKLFPLIIIVVLMLLLGLKLISVLSPKAAARLDIRGIDLPDQIQTETETVKPTKWTLELRIIAWLAVLVLLIVILGFLYAIPSFLFLFLKLQGKHSWPLAIICSLAVLAFIYGIFVALLSVPFPEGLLL